jgi:hypothetical protein
MKTSVGTGSNEGIVGYHDHCGMVAGGEPQQMIENKFGRYWVEISGGFVR